MERHNRRCAVEELDKQWPKKKKEFAKPFPDTTDKTPSSTLFTKNLC